ncbi:Replication factor C subunit 1 [Vitis vinifera]|uniref:Replication factor C subunit 1 n=1 Tax=Vitis vinifera TaxID=29760 RepID=A0A438I832_VITVI|nr:Replication factor C subunit 1 [Vitis vinifera]
MLEGEWELLTSLLKRRRLRCGFGAIASCRLKGFGIWSNEALLAEVACYKGGKFASAKARSSTVLMGVENWPLMMCFVSGDLLLSVGAEGGEECYGVGVILFTWEAIWGRILTLDQLRERGWIFHLDATCVRGMKSPTITCFSIVPKRKKRKKVGGPLLCACFGGVLSTIALEELAERVNGDMRMALNQLQYMSLSMSVIKYDDVRQRLLSSAKDEDISPFVAVDNMLSHRVPVDGFDCLTVCFLIEYQCMEGKERKNQLCYSTVFWLFGFNGGKLRMDERIDLSMSDPDLVPLLIQENYINYRPTLAGKDDNGVKRMSLLARAAESIGNGDIINVQIRRYRQWQLSQAGSFASCITPAALLHGQRETLEQLNINGSSRGNTGKEGPGGNHKVGREAYGSSLWKAISKGGTDFFLRSRFAIGNGVRVRFWQDPWNAIKPLLLFQAAWGTKCPPVRCILVCVCKGGGVGKGMRSSMRENSDNGPIHEERLEYS